MRTGIVMVGPRAGQRTECKAKDPDKCRYHKRGSHEEMTPQALDLFNEMAAEDMAASRKANDSARRKGALSKADREADTGMAAAAANSSLPDDLAELAADLDSVDSSEAPSEVEVDAKRRSADGRSAGYDEAMDTVTRLHATYDGSAELASLQTENANTLKQASAELEINHGDWLDDPEVGPFVCMPGDEVEFRAPNGKIAATVLRPGSRNGELVSETGEIMISGGVVAFPGGSLVRLSNPAGMLASYGSMDREDALKFAKKCRRGTELLIRLPNGRSGIVILDGQGGVITEDTGEIHRVIDLQDVKIIGWRRPATYDERIASTRMALRQLALEEKTIAVAAENAARKEAWENRSAVQRMIDRAKGRLFRPTPMPAIYSRDETLFEEFEDRHHSLASKTGFRMENGRAVIG